MPPYAGPAGTGVGVGSGVAVGGGLVGVGGTFVGVGVAAGRQATNDIRTSRVKIVKTESLLIFLLLFLIVNLATKSNPGLGQRWRQKRLYCNSGRCMITTSFRLPGDGSLLPTIEERNV